MPVNTISLNQQMNQFDNHDSVWLFGYGSLIYKVDFPFLEQSPASIKHWTRRFWQGSHDHRGTREAPGRVVTLTPEQGSVCEGMAYLITPDVFAHLDHREKNGYLRISTELSFRDGSCSEGLTYIADEHNGAFLGPAPAQDIARQIAGAAGPSGDNRDYLTLLADSLRELSCHDEHVFSIEQHLLQL